MTIFNGRYSWDGTKKDNRDPITWFPGAYDLKIFDRTGDKTGIKHLKPYTCIFSKTGEGQSISVNPEKFAKHICYDFSLELEKVLWVEDLLTDKERYLVVSFSRCGEMGDRIFYKTSKRQPSKGEKKLIERAVRELKGVVSSKE